MTLGQALWTASKSFYDQQTLVSNGDETEKYAAKTLNFEALFPHYGKFWRYHVCPATTRPAGITFRAGVGDIASVITQRNYTVFMYLVETLEHLQLVDAGTIGPRNRNCYIVLMYAGNALQVFAELQTALCGKPGPLNGMPDLAKQLGVYIDPFPDWKTMWAYDRDLLSTYRNYLTHQGWFYCVEKSATNELLVLKPDAFQPGAAYTWTHADRDYRANPNNWFPVQDLCHVVVKDTIAFLDLAYEKICTELEPLLPTATYQALWGWQPNQVAPKMGAAGPGVPAIPGPLGTGYSVGPTVSRTAKTSGRVDNTPGGSGVRKV
jgi:hypothetical protein